MSHRAHAHNRFTVLKRVISPEQHQALVDRSIATRLETLHREAEQRRLVEEQTYLDNLEKVQIYGAELDELFPQLEDSHPESEKQVRFNSLRKEFQAAKEWMEEFEKSFAERETSFPGYLRVSPHWTDTAYATATGFDAEGVNAAMPCIAREFTRGPSAVHRPAARRTEPDPSGVDASKLVPSRSVVPYSHVVAQGLEKKGAQPEAAKQSPESGKVKN